jgi:hypothetical protein
MRTLIFQNSNKNIVRISALKIFIASLGLPLNFLGLPCLLYYLHAKSPVSPKMLQGSPKEATKKFKAEILTIFSLLFWKINVFQKSF